MVGSLFLSYSAYIVLYVAGLKTLTNTSNITEKHTVSTCDQILNSPEALRALTLSNACPFRCGVRLQGTPAAAGDLSGLRDQVHFHRED